MLQTLRLGLSALVLLAVASLAGCAAPIALPGDAAAAAGANNDSANTAYGWAFSGQFQ